MYLDISTLQRNGRAYKRALLRQPYRVNGKVTRRTIAKLSACSDEEIEAIRLALRHKDDLAQVGSVEQALAVHQGPSVGAVWLVYQVARRLGIATNLSNSREGKLASWQVIARVIDQGSRLSAVRLAAQHAACGVLHLGRLGFCVAAKEHRFPSRSLRTIPQIEKAFYRRRLQGARS